MIGMSFIAKNHTRMVEYYYHEDSCKYFFYLSSYFISSIFPVSLCLPAVNR